MIIIFLLEQEIRKKKEIRKRGGATQGGKTKGIKK